MWKTAVVLSTEVDTLGPQACNFIKKGALAQVFPCEFCEISKNIFLTEYLQKTATEKKGCESWNIRS